MPGVAVGGTAVAVGGTFVAVGRTDVAVGDTLVAVGGTFVAVGGTAVTVGGMDVAVGGTLVGGGLPPLQAVPFNTKFVGMTTLPVNVPCKPNVTEPPLAGICPFQ